MDDPASPAAILSVSTRPLVPAVELTPVVPVKKDDVPPAPPTITLNETHALYDISQTPYPPPPPPPPDAALLPYPPAPPPPTTITLNTFIFLFV